MVKITPQQAREFLDRINSNDKIVIFTHMDMDGFAAGILLRDYVFKKGAKADVKIVNYGTNRISDTSLNGINKVLITDLAPSMVWEDLKGLTDKEIFYTDHHQADKDRQVPDFVLELRTTEQGYIPSTRTVYELIPEECEEKLWLVTLGVLGDYAEKYSENNEFLQNMYIRLGMTYEYLLSQLHKVNSALIGAPTLEEAFDVVSKMKKLEEVSELAKYYEPVQEEMERIRKDYFERRETFGKVIYYHLETKYPGLKSAFINTASGMDVDNILVFSTKKGKDIVSVSTRNQSKEYDMIKVLQECIKGFQDAEAGGHKAAAGAQIHAEDLERFKENLKKLDIESVRMD